MRTKGIRNHFLASLESRMLTESTTPREVLMKATARAAAAPQADVKSILSLARKKRTP